MIKFIFTIAMAILLTGCYASSIISADDLLTAESKCAANDGISYVEAYDVGTFTVVCNNTATFNVIHSYYRNRNRNSNE